MTISFRELPLKTADLLPTLFRGKGNHTHIADFFLLAGADYFGMETG